MRMSQCLACSLVTFAFNVQAVTIDLHTDLATFQAAASNLANYDFDSDQVGEFTSKDFGDFTLSENSDFNVLQITDDGKLQFHETIFGNSTRDPVSLIFDSPINALGFNYTNTDTSLDITSIVVDSQEFDIGDPLSSGFFGFVITGGNANTFSILDDLAGGGRLDGPEFGLAGTQYDNFTYSVANVPLPASIWLFSSALLPLLLRKYRKSKV